jgi:hypothetical protein
MFNKHGIDMLAYHLTFSGPLPEKVAVHKYGILPPLKVVTSQTAVQSLLSHGISYDLSKGLPVIIT